jgi:hypothetical protein
MSKKSKEFEAYWGKLMGQAKVYLMGASDRQLKVMLFDVLNEFFDQSNCWVEAVPFTVIPETLEYKLYVTQGRIVRLDGVIDQHGSKQQAVMPDISTVRFLYPYTQAQPMTAYVVKTVTDPLLCFPPNIPDWILPKYSQVILHGLVGNMMMLPAQSYTNPEMAKFYLAKFNDGTTGAYVAFSKANTVGAQAWAFPQSHRSSSQRGGISTYNVHPVPR